MKSRKLLEEFNVQLDDVKTPINNDDTVFSDKDLLD